MTLFFNTGEINRLTLRAKLHVRRTLYDDVREYHTVRPHITPQALFFSWSYTRMTHARRKDFSKNILEQCSGTYCLPGSRTFSFCASLEPFFPLSFGVLSAFVDLILVPCRSACCRRPFVILLL